MHRHDQLWLDLADHLDRLGRTDRTVASNRDQENVGVFHELDLLGGGQIGQIAEMADPDIVDVDDVRGVAGSVGSRRIGPNTGDDYAAYFVFARPIEHGWLASNFLGRVVVRMAIRNRDQVRGRPTEVIAGRFVARIGNDGRVPAA